MNKEKLLDEIQAFQEAAAVKSAHAKTLGEHDYFADGQLDILHYLLEQITQGAYD